MKNSPYIRATMAQAAMELIPPLIRKSLLNEPSFRNEYGFKTQTVITFSNSGLSIKRTELFDSVRAVFAGASEVEMKDVEGCSWCLRKKHEKEGRPILVALSGEKRIILPDLTVLAPDASIRVRSLDEAASDVNLPINAIENWRNILRERSLEDDEVDPFHSDIRDTPIHLGRRIRSEIVAGQSSVSSLVPNSRRYFNRLVGTYDGSISVRDYAEAVGRRFFQQLSEWKPYNGFLYSLFLSSHDALTFEISVDHLDTETLVKAYKFVEEWGDTLSRLGALEVGLRILPERPEVERYLLPLVHRIRDDDVESAASEFGLFSALFVLVDGELSRTRLMSEAPPFYRRLASLAHAALIHRQLVHCRIDYDHFSKWAFSSRGEYFFIQSLADMRTEPRWNPELADPNQMKADFFGRIMIAGNNFKKNIDSGDLHNLILGKGSHSLSTLSEFPHPYFPGPLEGAETSSNPLPQDIAAVIEQQLRADEVEFSSFISIVNSAMVFKITSGQAELAAKALRLANYRLANVENKSQLLGILNGLATVAAVSRNHELAAELRILVRRYRHDTQYGLSIQEAMKVCLETSAAIEELMEWREFAGRWLTELAFDEMEETEGEILHSHLRVLLNSVPELWSSCARAEAALKALCCR